MALPRFIKNKQTSGWLTLVADIPCHTCSACRGEEHWVGLLLMAKTSWSRLGPRPHNSPMRKPPHTCGEKRLPPPRLARCWVQAEHAIPHSQPSARTDTHDVPTSSQQLFIPDDFNKIHQSSQSWGHLGIYFTITAFESALLASPACKSCWVSRYFQVINNYVPSHNLWGYTS